MTNPITDDAQALAVLDCIIVGKGVDDFNNAMDQLPALRDYLDRRPASDAGWFLVYRAANNLMRRFGEDGEVSIHSHEVDEMMSALDAIDGGQYNPSIAAPAAAEGCERDEWRDLVQRAWQVLDVECPNEPITDELLAALRNTAAPQPVVVESGQ